MSTSAIDRAIASGRLIRLHPSVYAVGHAALRPDAHRLAAVLAAGPGAVLSHTSAAAAWGLLTDHRPRIDVTIPRARGRALPGLSVHRNRLHPADRAVIGGVPVTSVARTLLDVAATRPPRILERALERAEELRRFDLAEVDACLERHRGRRGAGRLRAAIADARPADPRTLRSWLERAVLALIDEHGLPRPAVNLDFTAGRSTCTGRGSGSRSSSTAGAPTGPGPGSSATTPATSTSRPTAGGSCGSPPARSARTGAPSPPRCERCSSGRGRFAP